MAKIVVADDDADIRDLVVFKLQQSGHQVVPVADGEAAVDACRDEHPDLAVLDVMMPGMSGLDACRALRGDPSLAGIAVVLLTARAQESDIAEGFNVGADDYVVKPFSPRELASRVAAVLQRSGA
jgi:two-component system, OmpR family, response regulator MtrA